ncbi:MAG: peptide chain release factor N(5)-glutamine methyltransferase [Oscillospiraceae bacterium]|nr:peptide chain release factor N(5)-glutamine methyltransferase [Oscillospiraceae bacterium]
MPKTYNDIYISLSRRLRDAGVEAHNLEARLIVAAAAGKNQAELLRDLQLYSSAEIEAKAASLAERRLGGEPAAYVTGRWGFYGLDLKITPDVLIPRSDTETLVAEAAARLNGRNDARILDLCTGSGCVGCALARALPHSRGVLLDDSDRALAVARENVWELGLADRWECVRGDVREQPSAGLGSFDLIVSNPPYVPSGELETLDRSVRDFEPRRALDGGADGLDFYRVILEHWTKVLRQSGWLLFEVGEDQAQAVEKLMRRAGLRSISAAKDSRGVDRVVCGKF